MNLLYWCVLSLGVLSIFYYMVIIIYSGVGTTFSAFWLEAGMAAVLISIIINYIYNRNIKVCSGILFFIEIVIITFLGILLYIEAILISYAKQKAAKGMDFIIILGAQVKGNRISKTLLKRLNTAVMYMKENPKTVAIVSGGKGQDEIISEAEAMKRYLIGKGIAQNRIIKEDKSKNTFENFLYSREFLKNNSSVACVTNGFHIYRAMSIARRQGISQIHGMSAPTDKILSVNYYVREAAGVIKDKIAGNL